MVAGPNEAANVEVLTGVSSPLRRNRWGRSVLGLLMYRGSCVYRFGAEPYTLVKMGPWGLAEKVVISWSLGHLGLGSSFTA